MTPHPEAELRGTGNDFGLDKLHLSERRMKLRINSIPIYMREHEDNGNAIVFDHSEQVPKNS